MIHPFIARKKNFDVETSIGQEIKQMEENEWMFVQICNSIDE